MMSEGKSFLIVTASVGSGHEKAAAAVAESIQKQHPEAVINIIDFMSMKTSWINAMMKHGYLTMLNLVPNLYEFMYQFTAGRKKGGFVKWAMSSVIVYSMKSLIRKYRPDTIICTHPFPADAVSHLLEHKKADFDSCAIITDYSVHQMWVCPKLNHYFVAIESMRDQLVEFGISRDIIHVSGIPVSEPFCRGYDKAECRRELGLSMDYPVIMMMGGGLGLGGMDGALDQLEKIREKLQLLVIAGRNEELKRKVEAFAATSHHHITALGYTDKVSLLMAASDVIITKPGALTLTEAMSLGLPMVLHEPIPGPETDNARFMSEGGMAVWLHSGDSLAKIIGDLLRHPEKLALMSQNSRKFRRTDAATTIAEYMS
ncbi:glycosyltransferase 28-like protein [Anaerovibrio sp. JC8]|uniref:MGDG synthase family glycosyltransferase n=1 Tax=Anaerovibrio sp. JC8 TaxID=1240085 RepID=UPI000A0AD0B4|nr:glycosyltransferase [Anaerovibrio sp. JC8]ORU00455.1 glycosyltransferase 28-like protein [Anaerovibrio sp. JC8]